jgi:glycosyltransferase involved in cell wall biosynthesis
MAELPVGVAAPDRAPIRSIVLVTSSAPSLANFRLPLIEALVGAELKVWALAPDFDAETWARIEGAGAEPVQISLDRTGMHPVRDMMDAARLTRTLRRLKPDAVFSYFIKPIIYGSVAARKAGVPRRFALMAGMGYVFTLGPRPSRRRRLLRAMVIRLYRRAFRACERVFFHNRDDLDEMVALGLLPREKAVLLTGTGVDLDHFRPAPPVEQPLRFLLVARLLREKGIEEYVAAGRALKARRPGLEFHLAGGVDPSPGGLTQDWVETCVRDGVIAWHGHVNDIRPHIAGSSVYVLPSYREGKPRSTQEAMAMARPVITTDAPGCRDTVEEGVNGFLVPARDSLALAAAMERFAAHPHLIRTMGAASRRLAEERFDVRKINRTILDTLGVEAPGTALC